MITSDHLGAAKRKAAKEGWAQWIRNAQDERAVAQGCWFDLRTAERVEEFFARFLRHSKGDFGGKPFTYLDWQRDDLFFPLFGWLRRNAEGKVVRRFQRAYVEIPKKNGKSTIASGIGTYMLVADGEPGAEIYSAATDKAQAKIVHQEAINMIRASDVLNARLKLVPSTGVITFPATKSFWRALSSRPSSSEGLNAHCLIMDELHAWKGAPGRALYDSLKWAGSARSNKLLFQITTAGEEMTGVCRQQHEYAQQVRNDTVADVGFLPLIYAANPDDDPWSEDTWRSSNPSLGHTISLESFQADADEACATPTSQARFKRYRLNIWTTGDSPWLRLEDWAACHEDYAPADLVGQKCYAGLDLSRTRDSTCLCLAFPGDDGEEIRLLPYFFLPREQAVKLRGVVPWETWETSKHVELIDGAVMDFTRIESLLKTLSETYDIQGLAFDPWCAEEVTKRMEDETGIQRFQFSQTMKNLAAPTSEFERLILSKKLRHNGHPIFKWQIGNAVVRADPNGNVRPVKPSPNDSRKIDGVVAGIMAVGLAMQYIQAQQCYYDDHDLEFV